MPSKEETSAGLPLGHVGTGHPARPLRVIAILLWLACALAFQSGLASPQERPKEGLQIVATGVGRPPAGVSSPPQAKAMAERAAFLQAIRQAAKLADRSAPLDYSGPVVVGAVIQGFRITRVTSHPDGSVEVEVTVPRAGISP